MDDTTIAGRFARALQRLEREGDANDLLDLYADDGRAGNVQQPGEAGRDGVARFWEAYRSEFGDVRSEFLAVVDGDDAAALEWETTGTVDGRSVSYRGATVLEIASERIVRSTAYYDPSALGSQVVGR